MACIYNTGATGKSFVVNPYDRMGQVMFVDTVNAHLNEVDELSNTERAEGGFGSTGRE